MIVTDFLIHGSLSLGIRRFNFKPPPKNLVRSKEQKRFLYRNEGLPLSSISSQGIPWSSAETRDVSVAAAERAGLKVAPASSLPTLADIDTMADLQDWCSSGLEAALDRPSTVRQLAESIVKAYRTQSPTDL
jgi:hypothetical protein